MFRVIPIYEWVKIFYFGNTKKFGYFRFTSLVVYKIEKKTDGIIDEGCLWSGFNVTLNRIGIINLLYRQCGSIIVYGVTPIYYTIYVGPWSGLQSSFKDSCTSLFFYTYGNQMDVLLV